MRKTFSILIGLFCLMVVSIALAAPGQIEDERLFDPEAKYSVEQLREDFDLLRTALVESHAGLYFYSPKEEMDRFIDSIFNQIREPMTEAEFHKQLALLIAHINDGHTGMQPSKQYQAYLSDLSILFPFNLRFIESKAYLFRNYSPHADLVMGGELVSLNGQPMSEILEKMLDLYPLGWTH